MKVSELMKLLENVDGDLEVCIYDSVYEDYTSRLCFAELEDEQYINNDEKLAYGNILLL